MRVYKVIFLCLFVSLTFLANGQNRPADFVNPMIGTGGTGHTFPGSVNPFGMVQLSPDTRIDGSWEGCSGYYFEDTVLYGFSHTHLSGTGCSDYGDILFMPSMKNVSNPNEFKSLFSHQKEKAEAGYYSLELNNSVLVELSSTPRVGIQKYTTTEEGVLKVLLDLKHRDKLLDGVLNVLDSVSINGFRKSAAWATEQELFFHSAFSKPFKAKKVFNDDQKITSIIFEFSMKKGESLIIKTALSPTSEKGALKNMKAEAAHFDFEKYRKAAFELWNQELSKILIETKDENTKTIFYSALYHCMIHPSINMDVDSLYKGRDGKIHKAENFSYYSVFSLWDTFRAEHPLLTLIDEVRTKDFLYTFLRQFKEGGRLPVWELSCNETDCMIGYHSVPVILDAIEKGIVKDNLEDFLEAAEKSAMADSRGLTGMKTKQFVSVEDDAESVSKSLEYAYDDWCIAQLAKKVGNMDRYEYYLKRSKSFLNLFDNETGFMRPRKNGDWLNPFDPTEVNNHFTEANSWQYSFFVPHDLTTLIDLHGGKLNFEKKLDLMFSTSSKTSGRQQADITGLIGQYAHGNEPSHHIVYLYNSIEKNEKTARLLRKIMNEFYKNDPDGLIGNEDCGQMSAWYVLSSIGIYPTLPGSQYYHIGSSLFDKITIQTKERKLEIINNGNSSENIFVSEWKKNNTSYMRSFISQEELSGKINFTYQNANSKFGTLPSNYFSSEEKIEYIPAPIIHAEQSSFEKETQIKIIPNNEYQIYYSTDGVENSFKLYKKPFKITQSGKVFAYYQNNKNKKSSCSVITLSKRPNQWKIKLEDCKYNRQYTAGGETGIIDGEFGSVNWRVGGWQGYQSQDFTAVIDLVKTKKISCIGGNFLQDTRSWILFPNSIETEISLDGKSFTKVGKQQNTVSAENYELITQKMETCFVSQKARYIRIKVKNFGKLPEWHQGYGGDAFIFVDEIWVK